VLVVLRVFFALTFVVGSSAVTMQLEVRTGGHPERSGEERATESKDPAFSLRESAQGAAIFSSRSTSCLPFGK
jgi:hypothetical protein